MHLSVLAAGYALPGEGSLHCAVHGGEAADQRNDFEPGTGVVSGAVKEPEEKIQVAEPVRSRRVRELRERGHPGVRGLSRGPAEPDR